MAIRILITDGLDGAAAEELRRLGHTLVFGPLDLTAYDAIIIRSATTITADHIRNAKPGPLKLIIRAGVGLDNIDTEAASRAGIQVRNTPEAPANAVAELAMAHLLSCARGVSWQGHAMRQGQWEKKNGSELYGKRLGILGYGRIGGRIAALAKGFGMEVASYDPALPILPPDSLPLDTILHQSDYLVLAMPALDKPIIDRNAIHKMKDGVILVNISRGQNVDETALLEGLEKGKIRAVGLDVWETEPPPLNALLSHPAVSCTPHIGASTREAQERIGRGIVAIIEEWSCES